MDFAKDVDVHYRLLEWIGDRTNPVRTRVYLTQRGWRVFEPGQDYHDTQKIFESLPEAMDYAVKVAGFVRLFVMAFGKDE